MTHIGDDVHIVLQSDEMFFRGSANLNPKSFPILDNLARLLTNYEKTSAIVTAYTDNVNTPDHDQALSRRQAQAIASYLWRRGTDTRLLVTKGKGQMMPTATNRNEQGRAQNRRVEIDFRQLYG